MREVVVSLLFLSEFLEVFHILHFCWINLFSEISSFECFHPTFFFPRKKRKKKIAVRKTVVCPRVIAAIVVNNWWFVFLRIEFGFFKLFLVVISLCSFFFFSAKYDLKNYVITCSPTIKVAAGFCRILFTSQSFSELSICFHVKMIFQYSVKFDLSNGFHIWIVM